MATIEVLMHKARTPTMTYMVLLLFFPLVEQILKSALKFKPEHMLVSSKSAIDIAQIHNYDGIEIYIKYST